MFFLQFLIYPYRFIPFLFVIFESNFNVFCDSGSQQFNASLRDFSIATDTIANSTDAKTLHIQDNPKFYNQKISRIHNPIRFQETADNSLSSSSYSRGFAPHEYSGYNFNGYEIGPYEGGGGLENYHHVEHEPHFPMEHGYRHKIHDHHALAVKTFLWPLAGIALLGAAAALVTNPVLLQLGVVSGRRKRSTNYGTTTDSNDLKYNKHNIDTKRLIAKNRYESYPLTSRSFNPQVLLKRRLKRRVESMSTTQPNLEASMFDIPPRSLKWDDNGLIPIPLKYQRDV